VTGFEVASFVAILFAVAAFASVALLPLHLLPPYLAISILHRRCCAVFQALPRFAHNTAVAATVQHTEDWTSILDATLFAAIVIATIVFATAAFATAVSAATVFGATDFAAPDFGFGPTVFNTAACDATVPSATVPCATVPGATVFCELSSKKTVFGKTVFGAGRKIPDTALFVTQSPLAKAGCAGSDCHGGGNFSSCPLAKRIDTLALSAVGFSTFVSTIIIHGLAALNRARLPAH
jgi:hypothetical protein